MTAPTTVRAVRHGSDSPSCRQRSGSAFSTDEVQDVRCDFMCTGSVGDQADVVVRQTHPTAGAVERTLLPMELVDSSPVPAGLLVADDELLQQRCWFLVSAADDQPRTGLHSRRRIDQRADVIEQPNLRDGSVEGPHEPTRVSLYACKDLRRQLFC